VTHQQRAGLVVIGVAVVLLAVVAVLRPHLVPGAGQAAAVLGPPAVGDCVLDPLPSRPPSGIVTAASGGTVPMYPAQQIRTCTGARYGEITAVVAAPKPTVVKGDSANNFHLYDPNEDSCVPTTIQYLGMTTQPLHRFWQTYLQINVALSRPSPRQEAAGQHWAACLVSLQPPDPAPATATAPAQAPPQYGTSIRNALHTGQ